MISLGRYECNNGNVLSSVYFYFGDIRYCGAFAESNAQFGQLDQDGYDEIPNQEQHLARR